MGFKEGPDCYCPDWAVAFFRAKDYGGGLQEVGWLWGINRDDMEYFGPLISTLATALAIADGKAQARAFPNNKGIDVSGKKKDGWEGPGAI